MTSAPSVWWLRKGFVSQSDDAAPIKFKWLFQANLACLNVNRMTSYSNWKKGWLMNNQLLQQNQSCSNQNQSPIKFNDRTSKTQFDGDIPFAAWILPICLWIKWENAVRPHYDLQLNIWFEKKQQFCFFHFFPWSCRLSKHNIDDLWQWWSHICT